MDGLISALIIGGFLQGTFLVIALSRMKKAKTEANRFLMTFLLLISFTLLARAQFDHFGVKVTFKVWGWLIDSFILLYSPLLLLYFQSVFGKLQHFWIRHLLPWLAYPFIILLYNHWLSNTSMQLASGLVIAAWISIHLIYYHIKSFSILNDALASNETAHRERVNFYRLVLGIIATCFAFLIFNGILMILGWESPFKLFDYNLTWILISLVSFAFGYMAIVNPGFYHQSSRLRKQVDASLGTKLLALMRDQEPFLDPDFDLQRLADLMGVKKQLISDALHVNFDSNFYDFINGYRVNKFIEISKDQRHLKFLALAYQAGFNSKTTFYKAFRKHTSKTPSQYFREDKNRSSKLSA